MKYGTRQQKSAALGGLLFISPWLIGFVLFNLWPMLYSLFLSFTKYSLTSPPRFIGFGNYIRMFTQDSNLLKSVGNTLYFVAFYVPLSFVLGFGLAVLMNQKVKAAGLFRTVIFLPSLVTIAASAVIWSWLLNTEMGIINYLLNHLGFSGVNWFSVDLSKISILIMALWSIGSSAIIYLVGLQGISGDVMESSYIDGASPLQRLLYITLPMMTPIIFFNLLIALIASLQIFAEAYILTKGGPVYSSTFYVYYLYKLGFELLNMGYAAAVGWMFFIVVVLFVIAYQKYASKYVFYQ